MKSFYDHHGVEMFELDDQDDGDLLRCKRCGATGLYWQEVVKADGKMGFALFNESNQRKHECSAAPDTEGFTNEETT